MALRACVLNSNEGQRVLACALPILNGGVTKPWGDEIGDNERRACRVLLESGAQTVPLADLGEGDNNHERYLESDAPVSEVSCPAGLLTDPREDANPATKLALPASRR